MNEQRDAEPQTLEYAGGSSRRRRGIWIGPVLLCALTFVVTVVFRLQASATTGPRRPPKCYMNLRRLSQAIYVYAENEPSMAFPDKIGRIFDAKLATPKDCHCPKAPAGRPSYYYVPGLSAESDPSAVVMYEDPRNHRGEGGNVLFVDSHVEYVRYPKFQAIVDAHRAAAQPVLGRP